MTQVRHVPGAIKRQKNRREVLEERLKALIRRVPLSLMAEGLGTLAARKLLSMGLVRLRRIDHGASSSLPPGYPTLQKFDV